MDTFIIKRDGLPPIKFTGKRLGSGSNYIYGGQKQTRWTDVEIYLTKNGRYVGEIHRQTCWQGESSHRTASSFPTASDLIDWLKEGQDRLGAVSQEAVEEAASNNPDFAASWVEEVE